VTRRFAQTACIDWSGQAVERPKGIAIAVSAAPDRTPTLLRADRGWSRQAVLEWLLDHARNGTDMLVGIDFSAALPFRDRGAYFPDWGDSPPDARGLWRLVDALCAADPHLAATTITTHAQAARHFRMQRGKAIITGDLFGTGLGRLRIVEQICRAAGHGNAASCFNLIGAAQVGKSSLTGMRLLNRLDGAIPIWPFDPVPAKGPMVVEIYTSLAARATGLPRGRSKMRDPVSLAAALAALELPPPAPLDRYDDHSTDAILTAAWLRRAAVRDDLWRPAALSDEIGRVEGWTFGVP
jgi:hypothetical protein